MARTPAALMNGLLFAPERDGPHPALVMLPEVFGVNEAMRELAQTFVARGYGVLLFDLYWRYAPGTALGYDDPGKRQARALHEKLDYGTALADIRDGVAELRALPWSDGRAGVIGYCLGGTLAYRCACDGFVDAAVAYYGTRIDRYLGEVSASASPTLLHVGERDHFTPPKIRERFATAFDPYPQFEMHVYSGADHGFANPHQEQYFAEAAKRADERTCAFLTKTIEAIVA